MSECETFGEQLAEYRCQLKRKAGFINPEADREQWEVALSDFKAKHPEAKPQVLKLVLKWLVNDADGGYWASVIDEPEKFTDLTKFNRMLNKARCKSKTEPEPEEIKNGYKGEGYDFSDRAWAAEVIKIIPQDKEKARRELEAHTSGLSDDDLNEMISNIQSYQSIDCSLSDRKMILQGFKEVKGEPVSIPELEPIRR